VDLLTLLRRLECLRSVSAFAFPASYSSGALALRRLTAARIVNDLRATVGVGFSAEDASCTGRIQLPTIQQIDASITMIRVALSGGKDLVWEGPLLRVPPIGQADARQLLSGLWGETVTAGLDWTVGTIELSQLALELGLIAEAAALSAEVVSRRPEPAELHDLYTICGCCEAFEARTEGAASHLLNSVDVLLKTDAYVGGRNLGPNVKLATRLLDLGCVGPVEQFLEKCKRCWPGRSDVLAGWVRAITLNPKAAVPHELEVFNDRNILSRIACLTLIPRTNGLTNEDLKAAKLQIRNAVRGRLPSGPN
jgi:hypothetical protein